MKIALVGGGGFRAPLVWEALAELDPPAAVTLLALHDVDDDRLARIGAVVEGLRRERGGGPPVVTTTNLDAAVDGATAVLCSIRVGGLEARVVDERVPLEHGVLGQETVGPGGICFALRTIPAVVDVARVVAGRAPSSWFVNFTNPAGIVTEAVRGVVGDRAVGICDSPAALCARVAHALGRDAHELDFDYAGLNHLGWLLAARAGGTDLLPGLVADDRRLGAVEEARLVGLDAVRALGAVPNEYVVYYERTGEVVDELRRRGATRAEVLLPQQSRFYERRDDDPAAALAAWRRAKDERFGTYMAEARDHDTTSPPHPSGDDAEAPDAGDAGYASIAAAFVRAVAGGAPATLTLDVANRGRIPALDDDDVVELPSDVGARGVAPRPVSRLPAPLEALVVRVKEVERNTLAAVSQRSRARALDALASHPVVPSRDVAERILLGYLAAFPGLARRLR